MPSWDNTARRQNNGTIVGPLGAWLGYLRTYVRGQKKDGTNSNFIFVNAWSEGGEWLHARAGSKLGSLLLLEEVLRWSFPDASEPEEMAVAREKLLHEIAALLTPAAAGGARKTRRPSKRSLRNKPAMHRSTLWSEPLTELLRPWPLAPRAVRAAYRVFSRSKR